MSKFVIPTEPIPGESLMGFVARACNENGHPSVTHVLKLAGWRTVLAYFLSNSVNVDIESVAQFLGCRADELRSRMQLPIIIDEALPKSFFNHLGLPVRATMREPELRRVSAASLRMSPHHRALWTLRSLRYCPESGELLISNCPNPLCGKALGWTYAHGISFCESCVDDENCPTTDLRDFELPRIAGDELALYRTITNLLDNTTEAKRALPPFFESWSGWECFDMVVMLTNLLCKNLPDREKLRARECFLLPDWHENFISAARMVVGWPDSASELVKLMVNGADGRSGHYGRRKELGALASFRKTYALPKAKEALGQVVTGYYAVARGSAPERMYQTPPERANDMISYREALTRYDVTTAYLTSIAKNKDIEVIETGGEKFQPTYYNERQLAELLESRRQLLLVDRLMMITGLPGFAIQGLIQSGHILLVEGALARFRDPSVHQIEVERFCDRIEANAQTISVADGKSLLKTVLDVGGTGGGLLLRLAQLCLDGQIEYSLSKGDRNRIMSRVVLPANSLNRVEFLIDDVAAVPAPKEMTRSDVKKYLDMPMPDLLAFVKAGVLRANAKIDGESVQRFNESYVTASTIARRLRVGVQLVRPILSGRGIQPALSVDPPGRSKAFAWRRAEVTPIIKESVLARRQEYQTCSAARIHSPTSTKRPMHQSGSGLDV